MKAQELLDKKAKVLEGTTEEIVIADCGMEATIIYKIVDGKDYLKALDALQAEEQNKQEYTLDRHKRLENLENKLTRAEGCNPEWSLVSSKMRRIMLERQKLFVERELIYKKIQEKKKENPRRMEILFDNIGPGYQILQSDKEMYGLLDSLLEPEEDDLSDVERYRNGLKMKVDMLVDTIEELHKK